MCFARFHMMPLDNMTLVWHLHTHRNVWHAGGLQRYASVLVITPLASTDEGMPRYSTRTQGEPGTPGFRTFVQDR